MRTKIGLFLLALSFIVGLVDSAEACWHRRHCRCYCPPVVTLAPPPAPKPARARTAFVEGAVAEDDAENAQPGGPKAARARTLAPLNVTIPDEDIFAGAHRFTPKTTVVHGGDNQVFDDVGALIDYFESPTRRQEQWWRVEITQTTETRNPVELVNVTVNNAWIYEISHQADNDYHLLIGINPDSDDGRYLNAEVSGINPDSSDASDLWTLRQSFKQQYQDNTGKPLPTGYTQPKMPIHIRVTGSILLDADHGRAAVGHGDIKNFTSWEIHPITAIQIVGD